MALTIAEINSGPINSGPVNSNRGRLAISPMPGRAGDYAGDLADVLAWQPGLVITLTTQAELDPFAPTLAADLARHGILWRHFPIMDYSTPESGWPALSSAVHSTFSKGDGILLHCMGGCGRSGMIALRLMVEAGEEPGAALIRLRAIRPCAVETEAQRVWAASGRL